MAMKIPAGREAMAMAKRDPRLRTGSGSSIHLGSLWFFRFSAEFIHISLRTIEWECVVCSTNFQLSIFSVKFGQKILSWVAEFFGYFAGKGSVFCELFSHFPFGLLT